MCHSLTYRFYKEKSLKTNLQRGTFFMFHYSEVRSVEFAAVSKTLHRISTTFRKCSRDQQTSATLNRASAKHKQKISKL